MTEPEPPPRKRSGFRRDLRDNRDPDEDFNAYVKIEKKGYLAAGTMEAVAALGDKAKLFFARFAVGVNSSNERLPTKIMKDPRLPQVITWLGRWNPMKWERIGRELAEADDDKLDKAMGDQATFDQIAHFASHEPFP